MTTLRQLERLRKAHQLIKQEKTGCPKEFADKLHISERELYRILEHLKEIDAHVSFSRKNNSYYYKDDFDLLVNISVQVLLDGEIRTINAGSIYLTKNFFTDRLWR